MSESMILGHGGSLTWDELTLIAIAYALIMVLANAGRDRGSGRIATVMAEHRASGREGSAVSIVDVSHRYGSKWALRRVSVDVPAGSFVSIVGPNGAGKTTLLEVLSGTRPSAGEIVVDGLRGSTSLTAIRSLTGVVGHHTMLYPDLTIEENLHLTAELYGLANPGSEAARAVELVDLQSQGSTRVGDLSHGQRQRAMIARALIHGPGVLLLDEPFSGLDLVSVERLIGLLARLTSSAGGGALTVFMTCHDLGLVHQLSDRVLIMNDGRLVLDIESGSRSLAELEHTYRETLGVGLASEGVV